MRTANWEKHGPFLPAPWKVFWPSRHLANFKDSMIESKAYYEEHNERVIKTVPKHRLLIWNVKDGWEPLCKFLGKEVPNIPIPVRFLLMNLFLLIYSMWTRPEKISWKDSYWTMISRKKSRASSSKILVFLCWKFYPSLQSEHRFGFIKNAFEKLQDDW